MSKYKYMKKGLNYNKEPCFSVYLNQDLTYKLQNKNLNIITEMNVFV